MNKVTRTMKSNKNNECNKNNERREETVRGTGLELKEENLKRKKERQGMKNIYEKRQR
jgi:hypothetical protein